MRRAETIHRSTTTRATPSSRWRWTHHRRRQLVHDTPRTMSIACRSSRQRAAGTPRPQATTPVASRNRPLNPRMAAPTNRPGSVPQPDHQRNTKRRMAKAARCAARPSTSRRTGGRKRACAASARREVAPLRRETRTTHRLPRPPWQHARGAGRARGGASPTASRPPRTRCAQRRTPLRKRPWQRPGCRAAALESGGSALRGILRYYGLKPEAEVPSRGRLSIRPQMGTRGGRRRKFRAIYGPARPDRLNVNSSAKRRDPARSRVLKAHAPLVGRRPRSSSRGNGRAPQARAHSMPRLFLMKGSGQRPATEASTTSRPYRRTSRSRQQDTSSGSWAPSGGAKKARKRRLAKRSSPPS